MARKLPRLQRALNARALFSVAYGEIASSIYFALGVIALHALGFTPAVLLVVGVIFLLVSLSYAEGTAAIPETGGAATLVRRTFNDLAGFTTGWALFLDYLIVTAALRGQRARHRQPPPPALGRGRRSGRDCCHRTRPAGTALEPLQLLDLRRGRRPGDAAAARRSRLRALALTRGALVRNLTRKLADWGEIAFALPLAFLAYTGLETVANLAEEVRRPGLDLPRSLFSAIVVVVGVYVAIALVGLSAFPATGGETALGGEWLEAPLMGIVDALAGSLPGVLEWPLRVYVGATAALILVAAATTSISGFGRLAYSLGEHGQLPRVFGRLHRRTLVSPQAIVAAAVISTALLIGTAVVRDDVVASLASLFSFGILLTFSAAQLAVIALRVREPDLPRPFRVPLGLHIGRVEIPLLAVVGLALTLASGLSRS